jgi:hypothetical protein
MAMRLGGFGYHGEVFPISQRLVLIHNKAAKPEQLGLGCLFVLVQLAVPVLIAILKIAESITESAVTIRHLVYLWYLLYSAAVPLQYHEG